MTASPRRSFRSGLVAWLCLLGGAVAVGSAIVVLRDGGDARDDPAESAGVGSADGDAAEAGGVSRRERVRVAPEAGAEASAALVETESPPRAEADVPPAAGMGTVVPTGPTRSGAPLRVISRTEPFENGPPILARAVADGALPELATEWFVAAGPDAPTDPSELVGDRDPVLEVGVPVALTGRVVDLADGRPIAGAAVLVTSTFYVRQYQYDHHLREVARVRTDADGFYAINRLNADPVHFGEGGRVLVTVRAGGFAPAEAIPLENVKPGYESMLPDVVLAAETHTLRGRVTDHWEDLPVNGVRVVATGGADPISYPKDQRDALFLGAPATVTDADGHFALTGLGPGQQWVSVHHGDDCIGRDQVDVPTQDDVVIRAHPARGHITGRVVDAWDDPVPLAIVGGGFNNTHSFADGSFVLENFRGDVITIDVAHPEFMPLRTPDVADGTEQVVLRLEHRRPRVRLDVRDADTGDALRHVTITLVPRDGGAAATTASPHYLDEHGVHEVVLPAGTGSLVIAADGRTPETVPTADLRDGDERTVLLSHAE